MNEYKQSLNQIQLADERGQTAVVVELCRKHLRKFPNDGIAWVYYGIAQLSCCRYAAAEKSFRKAFDLYPQGALCVVYSQMGHVFKNKGDFKQAAFWYRKAVKHKPHDATYHIFLADNAFKFGFFEQAKKKFRNALKCSQGALDEAYYNLGAILVGERKYADAIKCFEEALKIDPKYKIAKTRLEDTKLALLIANS